MNITFRKETFALLLKYAKANNTTVPALVSRLCDELASTL